MTDTTDNTSASIEGAADATETVTTTTEAETGAADSTTTTAATETQTTNDFPADWRQRMAGDDAALLKKLERYASPKAFGDAYKNLNDKVAGGELKRALPKDATPEDVAAWRKENGIPEAADGYYQAFGDDLKIPEEQKPLIDKFVSAMHGKNASPEVVKTALGAYYQIVAEQEQALADADAAYKIATEGALRQEWGAEFNKNMQVVGSFLGTLPTPVAEAINTARGPDGLALANNPEILRWLADMAYAENPIRHIIPSSHTNPQEYAQTRLKEIAAMIGSTDKAVSDKYWKDEKLQKEYQELLAAEQKFKKAS